MSAAHPATAPPAPACYLPSLQQNAPAIPAIALSTKLGHKATHVVTEELKTGSLAGSGDSDGPDEPAEGGPAARRDDAPVGRGRVQVPGGIEQGVKRGGVGAKGGVRAVGLARLQ